VPQVNLKRITHLTPDTCFQFLVRFSRIRGQDNLVPHSGYSMARFPSSCNGPRCCRPNGLPLSRERRASHFQHAGTAARRSSVCSGLLCRHAALVRRT
jgi:hypothetical protein